MDSSVKLFYLGQIIWVGVSLFFFFSSRRRHTRLVSDWSSDVCSSDLGQIVTGDGNIGRNGIEHGSRGITYADQLGPDGGIATNIGSGPGPTDGEGTATGPEIGRASCRERV